MRTDIAPILAALRRSKLGAGLLVLQVALTLAVVGNVFFIVDARREHMHRPTGIDETGMFAVGFRLDQGEGRGLREADLAGIRAIGGVLAATAINTYPLRGGGGWVEGISVHPAAKDIQAQDGNVDVYAFDERGAAGLGLHIVEGRDFRTEDVKEGSFNRAPLPAVAMVSRSLAMRLFHGDSALGKTIYLSADADRPLRIVGVIEHLQTTAAATTIDAAAAEDSVAIPMVDRGPRGLYLVRASVDRIEGAMAAVPKTLLAIHGDRTLGKVKTLASVREAAYEKDRAIAITLSIICAVLVAVTALGIVGLTSFWVGRRYRQIGVRRALGATRMAIVRYFLVENAMLCLAGVTLGTAMASGLNIWLDHAYGVGRLPGWPLGLGAAAIMLLGQLSAAMPSVRASRIEPVAALRSI